MKQIFTILSVLVVLSSMSFGQVAERKVAILPNSWKPHPAPTPYLVRSHYIRMGAPLVHDAEALAYYSPDMIDADGQIVSGQYNSFPLPDTSDFTFADPAGDGSYFRNQYMERFSASDGPVYLDSVLVAFFADNVPSKITCWVIQDTLDQRGNPAPNVQGGVLAVASIPKSVMAGKDDQGADSLTLYTVPFKHKLLNTNDVALDPNSFYVSLSTVTTTSTVTGAPFFGVPGNPNRFSVLTDNYTDNSGPATDYELNRMHWTATRKDGQYVAWNNIAHNFYSVKQTTEGDTAWLYPNMFMIAYVSYDANGVGDTKLEGNALGQNFPNPFNPSTEIKYSLANSSPVSLKVYNTLGVEVATILNDQEDAGQHEVNFFGDNLPSGTYFYTLKAGSFSQTKRMVLSK